MDKILTTDILIKNEIIFILDRSGSMRGSEKATLQGYNEFLSRQRQSEFPTAITTVLFDNKYELLHDCTDIRDTRDITQEEYYVRGNTALLDAVGRTICSVRDRVCNSREFRHSQVIFVIITDGHENASRKFTYAEVRQLIAEQKKQYGWEFIFLGADISDMQDADGLGIGRNRRTSYTKNGSGRMFAEMSEQVESFKRSAKLKNDWNANIAGDIAGMIELPYMITPGGFALVDTGSPISFGNFASITIDGHTHPLARNGLLDDIRRNTSDKFAALLGMDILSRYDMIIKKSSMLPELYSARQIISGIRIPVTARLGIPVLPAKLNGRETACVLDTGAHIQYVVSSFTAGLPPIGETADFYPGIGKFSTKLYPIDVEIAGEIIPAAFGVMPPELETMMAVLGTGGVLGLGCFKDHSLLLCPRDGYMKIWQ